MQLTTVRRVLVQVALAAILSLITLSGSGLAFAQGPLNETLLAEGEKKQVIQFNPGAALQKRIFADGFVPNSSEFNLGVEGVNYAAQRAENLGNGQVRVYYVVVGDWGNVRFVQRGAAGGALGEALLAEGEKKQVIQFNPGAALQQRIFGEGFVPNSPEFGLQAEGKSYAAQRAENLGNGQVRVYFVVVGDWGNVNAAVRGGGIVAQQPPPQPGPAPAPAPAVTTDGDTFSFTEGDLRFDGLRVLRRPPGDLPNPIEKRINEATVQLVVLTRTDIGIATGTVIGPDGHTILTAFHVVGDLSSGKVYDPLIIAVGPYLNYTLRATVVSTDAPNDLAVIRVQPRPNFGGFTFLSLSDSNSAQLGDSTFVFSYPGRREGGLGRSTGRLIAVASNTKDNSRKTFLTEAVASPGSSGGVVTNVNGEVMGIISYGVRLPRGIDRPGLPTITTVTGFVPINLARPILAQAGIQ